MSRKWLEQEAPGWVKQEIITPEQAKRLVALYDDKNHAAGILPILGSILVGLGILTFVAANWQEIPHLVRFAILALAMVGFYTAGERVIRRGDERLGLALVGIGLAGFGASIFLIGQMFHLVAYNAGSFILWGSAGILLTYLYRSRFLFVLSAVILNGAQLYSLFSFGTFSLWAFGILIAGLGLYCWLDRNAWLVWLIGVSVMLQSIMLVGERGWDLVWFLVPALVLYALGDWIRTRDLSYPLQGSALTAAYLFGSFVVMIGNEIDFLHYVPNEQKEYLAYLAIAAVLLIVSMFGKWKKERLATSAEWLLLFPWFIVTDAAGLLHLLALCLFSLYVLWHGYTEAWRFKINLGTALFLFAILLAYTRLAWAFMDKSLFFLTGGVLLLALSWYLNRRRRKFLQREGGESDA